SITPRCASSNSRGLMERERISAASSVADLRVRLSSGMRVPRLFAGPVDELALDREEKQIQPIAERAGGEDRRVHVGHFEHLLRLESARAVSRGRAGATLDY